SLRAVRWTGRLAGFVGGFEAGGAVLRRAAKVPLELVLLLGLRTCAWTAVAEKPMIGFLYGAAYAKWVPVLVILGFCVPPMYMNILLAQVLVAMNRQASWTWVMAATTIVNPLLN